jgi:hypothetical protein
MRLAVQKTLERQIRYLINSNSLNLATLQIWAEKNLELYEQNNYMERNQIFQEVLFEIKEAGSVEQLKENILKADTYNRHREINSSDDWFREFNHIYESLTIIRYILKDLEKKWMPSEMWEVISELEQIAQTNNYLKYYFCSNPVNKHLNGQQLTREEFYLLAAQGIMIIPSQSGKEEVYKEFTHYLYEDNKQRGYINPSERPDPPPVKIGKGKRIYRTHLKLGIVPEKVRTSFLRADQLDYFKNFRPELFSRFREDRFCVRKKLSKQKGKKIRDD